MKKPAGGVARRGLAGVIRIVWGQAQPESQPQCDGRESRVRTTMEVTNPVAAQTFQLCPMEDQRAIRHWVFCT